MRFTAETDGPGCTQYTLRQRIWRAELELVWCSFDTLPTWWARRIWGVCATHAWQDIYISAVFVGLNWHWHTGRTELEMLDKDRRRLTEIIDGANRELKAVDQAIAEEEAKQP